MNLPEYILMCLNKLDFEYGKVLDVAEFPIWIWHMKPYDIWHMTYAFWIWHNMPCQSSVFVLGSKYRGIFSMAGFWICRKTLNIPQNGCICRNKTWICLDMSEFTIIDKILNMYQEIHCVRLLYKSMSTYWEIQNPVNYLR